jgi:AcrR family transcriptional regulator
MAPGIDDLLEASGMHRGSFYRSFGDKHSAFVAALTHYAEMVGEDHLVPALTGRVRRAGAGSDPNPTLVSVMIGELGEEGSL